jgi:hypothetical protein
MNQLVYAKNTLVLQEGGDCGGAVRLGEIGLAVSCRREEGIVKVG